MLAEQEEQDVAVQSARKEKARADANWMIKVCHSASPLLYMQPLVHQNGPAVHWSHLVPLL